MKVPEESLVVAAAAAVASNCLPVLVVLVVLGEVAMRADMFKLPRMKNKLLKE